MMKTEVLTMMHPLNFPTYEFKLRLHEGAQQVWDIVRKRWVVLTPEEWVRQHLIHFLHTEKQVPLTLMGIEKKLVVHGMTRRTDVVVYNKQGKPVLICECKEQQVKLAQNTMDQAARYNIALQVPLLLITNGLQHFCAQINFEDKSSKFLTNIPDFEQMGLL
jgi:hypothetical protein